MVDHRKIRTMRQSSRQVVEKMGWIDRFRTQCNESESAKKRGSGTKFKSAHMKKKKDGANANYVHPFRYSLSPSLSFSNPCSMIP